MDKHEIFNFVQKDAFLISVGFITKRETLKVADKMETANRIAVDLYKGILDYMKEVVAEPSTPAPTPIPPTTTEAPFTQVSPSQPSLPKLQEPSQPSLPPLQKAEPAPALKPIQTQPSLPALPTPTGPALKPLTTLPSPPTPAPTAVPMKTTFDPAEDIEAPLLNPVDGMPDQTWLFGEVWGNWPLKKGLSFNVPSGTSIRAVADGEIVAADDSGKFGLMSSYPNYVVIKHDEQIGGKEVYTLYARINGMKAKKGGKVKAGDIIGGTGAPYSETENRDTEFEFEVRVGGPTQDYVKNPELFIKPASSNTGCIVGRLEDRNGNPMRAERITGAEKPSRFAPYTFSMTYSEGVTGTDKWNENFVISDVLPGEHIISTPYGTKKAIVKAGMVTFIEWKLR
jgi:murein DD-endopeptidase MepM/ murein hydrolase activator NlpD